MPLQFGDQRPAPQLTDSAQIALAGWPVKEFANPAHGARSSTPRLLRDAADSSLLFVRQPRERSGALCAHVNNELTRDVQHSEEPRGGGSQKRA